MTKVVLWFVAFFIVAWAAVWLADNPGSVTIDFQGLRFYTSFAELTFLATALALLFGGLVWLIGWIRRDMPLFGSNQLVKRQARGLKMLNQSLVALSAGDHRLAGRLVEQAEVLLPPQPMVHLIAAEAAQRGGDHKAASKRFEALEAMEEGRLLGLRGLLSEARRSGHENEALRLARVAFEENRKSPWVLKTLFALEVAAGNWQEADTALKKVVKEGLLDKETGTRHEGALAYAEATELNLTGKKTEARKAFRRALSLRPGFVPATLALARLELGEGNKKRAEKIILDAWATEPHPGMAALYKELDLTESKADWLKRVRKLADIKPDHPQSLLLLTDGLMDAGDYETAKPVLDKLIKKSPTREAWQFRLALAHILAEDPDPIEAALAHAPEGALWQCGECGDKPRNWSPLCGACTGFDTIQWQHKEGLVEPVKQFDADKTIALLADTERF